MPIATTPPSAQIGGSRACAESAINHGELYRAWEVMLSAGSVSRHQTWTYPARGSGWADSAVCTEVLSRQGGKRGHPAIAVMDTRIEPGRHVDARLGPAR